MPKTFQFTTWYKASAFNGNYFIWEVEITRSTEDSVWERILPLLEGGDEMEIHRARKSYGEEYFQDLSEAASFIEKAARRDVEEAIRIGANAGTVLLEIKDGKITVRKARKAEHFSPEALEKLKESL